MAPQQQQLPTCLRWLLLCLFLLFAHDVLCFSLGYPFLPGVFGGSATGIAFSSYGLASIAVLLVLLFCGGSSTTSSSSGSNAAAAFSACAMSKLRRITAAALLAAAAGAANALLPRSYAVLLLTKAVQGAASALYFCDSLSLIAAVYPRRSVTQAMACVSAGLTVGDSLGPVVGGLVYQAAGLQAALGLQPAASLVAVAAWGVLLLWPRGKVAGTQQQQQRRQRWWRLGSTGNTLSEPLLPAPAGGGGKDADAAPAGGVGDTAAPCLRDLEDSEHQQEQQQGAGSRLQLASFSEAAAAAAAAQAPPPPPAAAAAEHAAQAPAPAGSLTRPSLLLQLLSRPPVLSLCLLALMAQAARTAVDLLLPMMLQDSVQPGTIGLLFAGEAVGSVVAPVVVDWMLHRHSSSGADSDGSGSCSSDKGSSGKGSSGGSSGKGSTTRCSKHSSLQQDNKDDSNSSSNAPATRFASLLLLLSAAGMAICCACVLTAWQLPAALAAAATAAPNAAVVAVHTPAAPAPGFPRPLLAAGPAGASGSAAVAETAVATAAVAAGREAAGNSTAAGGPATVAAKQALHAAPSSGLPAGWVGAAYVRPVPSTTLLAVAAAAAADTRSHSSAMVTGDTAGVVGLISTGAGWRVGSNSGFGVVELLIIGFVLMLLGSCHSSCETLIYTVLTHLIARESSGTAGVSGSSGVSECASDLCESVSEVCEKSEGSCAKVTLQPCSTSCGGPECCTEPSASATVSCVGGSGMSVAAVGGVCCLSVPCVAAVDGPTLSAAASSSVEFDIQVQIEGSSGPSPQGSCSHLSQLSDTHTATRVTYGCPAASHPLCDIVTTSSSSSASDSTEVVMVLYALFWVVGFSAGAAVVGVLPGGSSLGQLQAVATVLALLLASAGRWCWLAVGE